tara:strand:+ start:426 stop:653 length:228 start_codon:yes stop_codon:yes gene_type:complete
MKSIKEINENVKKAVKMQSINEIMNIKQIEYRFRLFEYFKRENIKFLTDENSFNSDVMHDIKGLKYEDKHFLTRL